MKLPGQCCPQDVGSCITGTHWSLQRCKKLGPVCWYRQHSFICGNVVFHRSYAAAWGRNAPVLVAVLGLKG